MSFEGALDGSGPGKVIPTDWSADKGYVLAGRNPLAKVCILA